MCISGAHIVVVSWIVLQVTYVYLVFKCIHVLKQWQQTELKWDVQIKYYENPLWAEFVIEETRRLPLEPQSSCFTQL